MWTAGKVSMTKTFSKHWAREQSTLEVTIDHLQVAHLRQASVSKQVWVRSHWHESDYLYSNANINHFHQKGFTLGQRVKKVVSDSPGLVDFAIGLVIFVQGKRCFLGESKLQKDCNQSCWSKRVWGLVEMTWRLVHASCCLPEWQAVKLTFFAPSLTLVLKVRIIGTWKWPIQHNNIFVRICLEINSSSFSLLYISQVHEPWNH